MKLYYNDASPFARKCRIILRLKMLLQQCDEIISIPLSNPPELLAANPIAQVPALILDDGMAIFNSPLICAYLDKMSKTPSAYGENELKERRLESLGDAISEMAVKIRMEQIRPINEQSQTWIKRWNDNLKRILDFTENEIKNIKKEALIGNIAIAVSISYLNFRFPDYDLKQYENMNELNQYLESKIEFIETKPK